MTEKTPKFEYMQMTDRTYEDYLTYLHLSEAFLRNKNILDVGGGLSEFAEEANRRLDNTRVMAIDINYDQLPMGSADEFRNAMSRRNVDFSHEAQDPKNLDDQFAWFEQRRQSILRKSRERSDFIAADMKHLPFADASFHLVLFNNSLYPYFNKSERRNDDVKDVFREGLRVLKDSGQLRIKTTPFRKLEEDDPIPTKEGMDQWVKLYQQEKYGHGDDSNPLLLERFKELAAEGIHFYLIQFSESEDGSSDWRNGSLVVTKGEHDFGDEDVDIHDPDETGIRVLRLDVSLSEGTVTPGKVVYSKSREPDRK